MLKDSIQSFTSLILAAMDVPFIFYSYSAFLFIISHLASALRCPDLSVRFGRVKYRSRGRVAIFGCWSGFLLYGEKYAACYRGAWDVTHPKCVRKGCSDVSFKFGTIRKPLTSNAVLAFRCYQGYDLVGPREIYCDGGSYDTLPPVCRRTETDISCDFENNNLCKWRSDQTRNLTFQLINTAPPSRLLNTGPDHDHTLDPETNGYYIYLETSSAIQGEAARISTPYLPHAADTNTCFKFWYHMFGLTMGTLRVYINDTVVFERQDNRGDRWRLGKAKLPFDSHFKIVVEAITGRGYLGDIALDDFDVGECTDLRGNTCADRCSEDENDLFASCNCHPGCVDQSSCCSDYRSYCVAETTTEFVEESVAPSELPTSLEETSITTIYPFEDELEDTYRTDAYTIEIDDNTVINTESDRFYDDKQTETTEIEREVHTVSESSLDIYKTSDADESTLEYDQSTSYKDLNSFETFSSPNYVENEDTTLLEESEIFPNPTTTIKLNDLTNNTTPRYNLRPRITTHPSVSTTKPTLKISTIPIQIFTFAKESTMRPSTTNRVTITLVPTRVTTKAPALTTQITSRIIQTATTTQIPTTRTTTTRKPTTRITTTTRKPTTRITTTTRKLITRTTTTTRIPSTRTTTTTLRPATHTLTSKQNPTTSAITIARKPSTHIIIETNTTPSATTTTTTFTPIYHKPVTVSTKDPKITTRSLPKPPTIETPIVIKPDESNDTLVISPNETLTYKQTEIPDAKKWVSTYKKKGAFKLIDVQPSKENAGMAGVTTAVAACLVVIVGSALAVILFMRKRRLSSGPSDGAEIVFIPADELLDFTPASGPNRDSGVYSDTVMSLKRDKGSKCYKQHP